MFRGSPESRVLVEQNNPIAQVTGREHAACEMPEPQMSQWTIWYQLCHGKDEILKQEGEGKEEEEEKEEDEEEKQ